MAVPAVSKLPGTVRKAPLEHTRSMQRIKLSGSSSSKVLMVTSFILLLLCSLFLLDMELIYHKTGAISSSEQPTAEPELLEAALHNNYGPGLAARDQREDANNFRTPAVAIQAEDTTTSSELDTPELLAMKTSVLDDNGDLAPELEVLELESSGEEAKEATTEIQVQSEDSETVVPNERVQQASKEERIRSLPNKLQGCDITQGRWVFDNVTYPLYRTKNCPFADSGFRCEDNGRPDKEFMSYHWQPSACDLPRFNASDVLERLRGRRMVFVGDSLGRNGWESMLCMLAEGVADKTRIFEVHGQPITKHSGKLVYRFEDYNCTVEYYREPFLVPQTRPPKNSPPNVTCVLRVDHVSWSAEKWINADIIVFNVGHWWTEHKIFRKGCRFQEDRKLMHYDVPTGVGKAMQTWATYLEKNLDSKRTELFWLSFPTVHFRGASWNRGGHCHQEKRPLTDEEARNEWQTPWINQIVMDKFMANIKQKLHSVTYLDITTATNYRPDGHGALYTWDTKKFGLKPRNRQDCSHFCLPGVPDAWNELVLGRLFAKGKGSWALPSR